MTDRELIIRIDAASSDGGAGVVFAYRLGSTIEIVVSEENAGDGAVVLSGQQAVALARALNDAANADGWLTPARRPPD